MRWFFFSFSFRVIQRRRRKETKILGPENIHGFAPRRKNRIGGYLRQLLGGIAASQAAPNSAGSTGSTDVPFDPCEGTESGSGR